MSTEYQPPSTYRASERGSIALVALVVMLVLAVLGMALLYFVRGGVASTREYLREMQLETAARGAIAASHSLVSSSNPAITGLSSGSRKKLAVLEYGASYSEPYPIQVTVTALRQDRAGTTYIYLIACAVEKDKEVSYERRKLAKGVWIKNANGYVYQGWAP